MKTMRQVFGEALAQEGEKRPALRVLDADVSSSTQTKIFKAKFPERFFNFGIAEGNMAAAAAGMATCGLTPVISTFAFLLSVRAMDSIHSLAAYNQLNVKIAGGYAGLSDHADGASHQGICDMAIMRAVPNIVVLAPSDEESTIQAVKVMLDYEGPVYIRLSRDLAKHLHEGEARVEIGRAFELYEGKDVGIITTGTTLEVALEARIALEAQGISAGIIEAISVKPLDDEVIEKMARKYGCLVTIEEHNVIGGLGDAVCASISKKCPVKVLKLGINDTFGQSARTYSELLKAYHLDTQSVTEAIASFVKA